MITKYRNISFAGVFTPINTMICCSSKWLSPSRHSAPRWTVGCDCAPVRSGDCFWTCCSASPQSFYLRPNKEEERGWLECLCKSLLLFKWKHRHICMPHFVWRTYSKVTWGKALCSSRRDSMPMGFVRKRSCKEGKGHHLGYNSSWSQTFVDNQWNTCKLERTKLNNNLSIMWLQLSYGEIK